MSTSAGKLHQRTCVSLVLCSAMAIAQAQEFAGGKGEQNDPYQIATAQQLISIGSDPNLLDRHFILLNDIDLDPNLPGGRAFVRAVIAPNLSDDTSWKGTPFKGHFDGRGHSIRNVTFQKGIVYYIGLFGSVSKGAMISDLRVENADLNQQYGWFQSILAARNEGRIVQCYASGRVSGAARVGLLVGDNAGEIIGCRADGEASALHTVGGLVGANVFGTIVNCHAASRVVLSGSTDFNQAGGLVGSSSGGVIVNCSATGNVSGATGNDLGGLVGVSDAIIANCYSTGDVRVERAGYRLGGLVGVAGGSICNCYANGGIFARNYSNSLGGLVGYAYGLILNSYATGRVSTGKDSKDVGGLTGFNEPRADIKACFWDVETTGLSQSTGGMGITTAQMQTGGTFVNASWDFDRVWVIREGKDYPRLRWENVESDN